MLARVGHSVLLVARPAHARAIREQGGLRVRSSTSEDFVPLDATERLDGWPYGGDACLVVTVKSNHTEQVLEDLAGVVPEDVPVVSFQNGVTNEEVLSRRFQRVYGGVCRMTCCFVHPGEVAYRRLGRLVVGRYPKGSDRFVRRFVGVLEEAGFSAVVSRNVVADKWLKLVVNLSSGLHAIVDPRDPANDDFTALKRGLLEEARRVLRAERIRARSCDGQDPSIEEMIEDLDRPRPVRRSEGIKVHNSTWQNLYLGRPDLENRYFHGPIIEAARRHAIPVPYNETALEFVERCHREKLGPECFRAREILEAVRRREESS
jgi:2-dehydropantoate 2-reductase